MLHHVKSELVQIPYVENILYIINDNSFINT